MSTLILHPGSPKTATTTLQHILRENRQALERKGIGLVLPEDIRGKPFLGAYMAAYRGKHVPKFPKITADFFAPYLARFRTVICSEETFCHDFMPSRRFGEGGIDRAAITAKLLSHAGADNTRVVLTIRPQMAFLISTYTHFVHRQGECGSFPEWFDAEVRAPNVRWTPAVEAFRNQFGSEAVRVVSMGQYGRIEDFLRAVLDAMDLEDVPVALPHDDQMNQSPSARAVQMCRKINSVILDKAMSEKLNTSIVAEYPVKDFGKFAPNAWVRPIGLEDQFSADHQLAIAPLEL